MHSVFTYQCHSFLSFHFSCFLARDGKRERESILFKSYVSLLPCRVSYEQLYSALFLIVELGAAKKDLLIAADRKQLVSAL